MSRRKYIEINTGDYEGAIEIRQFFLYVITHIK
jgi:hypothetical protein